MRDETRILERLNRTGTTLSSNLEEIRRASFFPQDDATARIFGDWAEG